MNDCDLFATYPARQSPTFTHPTVVPQSFAFYTASLLPVANVVLKIDSETSDIQSHSPPSTMSGSAGVGWGLFAVTSSVSHVGHSLGPSISRAEPESVWIAKST